MSGLRHELGLGWAVGLLTACLLGVALALRDVHHRVDQEEAGRQVFYAGRGSTAWFAVVMVGVAIVPGMVIPLLADGAATALGVGLFAAVLTAAAHGVLAATTTGEPQPEPIPVPLRREDG